jgi:phage tail-like protein
MTAHDGPEPLVLPAGIGTPSRVAASPGGTIVLLADAGTSYARLVPYDATAAGQDVPHATDLEFEQDDVIVVARRPGEAFQRFHVTPTEWHELPPLVARAYDGRGIVRAPDGRIAYWTSRGLRTAVSARLRYAREGRVTTFRLDSDEYQTTWGRFFVDACVPPGADLAIAATATDERSEDESLVPEFADPTFHPLYRRAHGPEIPWMEPVGGDRFVTYEAPVLAPAGRYLWVRLRLRGNTRLTPRLRCLRAEYPTHDYLKRLPRVFSREPRVADFLGRYLALFEGFLGELEGRATERATLVDPRGTPTEALRWLASFVGLVLDDRWPPSVCRTLIEEAMWLFRFRGTVGGLARFLEIVTGVPVVIVEQFRLRGLGGAMLGDRGAAFSNAIVGGGFRVGGAIDTTGETPLEGTLADAFRTHAHRFSVIVPAVLDEEQHAVVTHILEEHRPAHTIFELCTAGAGMRVGRGLHLGLSSIIGRTGGFASLLVGGAVLGRDAVIGRPATGMHPGAMRLGADSRVG